MRVNIFQKRLLLPVILFSLLPVSVAIADQPKPKQISIQYRATLAGIFIGKAKLRIAVTNNAYSIEGTATASGMLQNLTGFNLDVKSHGALSNHTMVPTAYITKYGDARNSRIIKIKYDHKRKAVVSTEPTLYPSPSAVPLRPDHFKNTLDPLSSLFLPIKKDTQALALKNCNRSMPVFDGSTRYNLMISTATPQVPMKTSARSYKGPALNCRIKLRHIAGHAKNTKAAKRFETRDEMQVWLAPIGSTGLLIPVRGLIPTPFGLAEVVAQKVYLDGQKVASL